MSDVNITNALLQKKIASEKAMREAAPIRKLIDPGGKVRIYLIREKKWKRFFGVDAMGLLKAGAANLTGPDPEQKESPIDRPSLENLTISELKEYADGNEIDISGLTKKVDIIEAIEKAEWERPQE
jgi:hypothetical protein